MTQTRFGNQVLFGAFLCAAGAAGLALTAELRFGTAMRMGPGYTPNLLAWLCIAFGAALIVRGVLRPSARPEPWRLRPLLAVSAAVAAFMLVPTIGLVAAVIVVTLIACAGDPGTRWLHAVVLAAGLAVFCATVFVRLLGLPFPLWPAFVG